MRTITLGINSDCNLACEFCYSSDFHGKLSFSKIKDLVKKYPETYFFEIDGREPLLHPDIVEIVKHLSQKDKKVHVSTNGTILLEELLDLPKKIRGNITMQVSLHASNAKLYQEITKANCFSQVIENIQKLKKAYETLISSVVYRKNFDDVQNIIQLGRELKVPVRINLAYNISKGKNVEKITVQQIEELRNLLLIQKALYRDIYSPLVHIVKGCSDNNCSVISKTYGLEKKEPCPADLGERCYITPDNKRYPCEFLQEGEINGL